MFYSAGSCHAVPIYQTVNECAHAVRSIETTTLPIEETVRVLSWNIRKASHKQLREDLTTLSGDADLIVLQEAIDLPWLHQLKPSSHFSPGYATSSKRTGLMLLGDEPWLFSCIFSHREPWLRTPKASSITALKLPNGAVLLAGNIHAVNFVWSLKVYRAQLENIVNIMQAYTGPMFLSGDFNTWRAARASLLQKMMATLHFSEVDFASDFRTRVFGLALDRVFTRGVQVTTSSTRIFESSDHNPLFVTFTVTPVQQ